MRAAAVSNSQRNFVNIFPRVSAVGWWGNRWSSACALLPLAHAAMSWTRSLDWRFISSITLRWTWLYFNGYFIHFVTLHLTYQNFGADIFWHSWSFHFLIAENVVGDFHVMIFCAAAMSWHTAELAWISPQGVGGVLMGKPLKFCMCTASSRACLHN